MKGLEIERRFLVRPGFSQKDMPKDLKIRRLSIFQEYLKKSSEKSGNRRVRCVSDREANPQNSYVLTEKKPTDDKRVRIENEHEISLEEYRRLEAEADPQKDSIYKERLVFNWKNQKFELDFFISPRRLSGLAVLEIELESPDEKVELPDFIPIVAEITGFLSNSDMAKRPQ